MVKANFRAYGAYVTDSLYQWDLNQQLRVSGLNLATAPEVHFSNANMARAIVRQAELVGGVVVVDIPNSLLQYSLRIFAHIGIYEGETFKTVEVVAIPVIPRARPEDYQLEDTDEELYSFKALENQIANIVANGSDTGGNSELRDIRYGADGKRYTSAGQAVRAQVSALAGAIDTLNDGGLNMKDGVIGEHVENWLDEHPEATTTVQDNSLTLEKFVVDALGYVTPQMFGAKGDGVTDDTAAIQAAVDAAVELGTLCKIPRGVYCFSDLRISHSMAVEGADKVLTRLKHTGTGDAITVKPEGVESWLEFPRVALRGITVENNANTTAGIRVSECIHSVFENLYIEGGKVGFFIDGTSAVQDDKNSVFNNEYKSLSLVGCSEVGLKIDGIISDSHFENLYAESCPVCVDMTSVSSHNVSFTDGSLIICEKAFYIHGLFNNVRIETFNLEQFSSHGIHIVGDGVNHCKNYTVANCLFFGNQESAVCVEAAKLSNSIIWNNNALGATATHIKLAQGCLGVMLMNNNKNNGPEAAFVADIPATCCVVNYVYDKQDAFAISAPIKMDKAIVNNVTLVDSDGGHSELKLFDEYSIAVKKGGYHTYILPAMTSTERLALVAPRNGSCVFDTTKGKPVWRAGDAYWVDATGARAD